MFIWESIAAYCKSNAVRVIFERAVVTDGISVRYLFVFWYLIQSCAEGARSLLSEDCAHERLGGDDR